MIWVEVAEGAGVVSVICGFIALAIVCVVLLLQGAAAAVKGRGMEKVRLSRDDKILGQPHSQLSCPVARAVRRMFPGESVRVTGAQVLLDEVKVADLPWWVRGWIKCFDFSLTRWIALMVPVSFTLGEVRDLEMPPW